MWIRSEDKVGKLHFKSAPVKVRKEKSEVLGRFQAFSIGIIHEILFIIWGERIVR